MARPGAETFLDVPVTIDDDEPLSGIGGAAILVPVGALTRPVALVLGTSTPIEPPAGGRPWAESPPGPRFTSAPRDSSSTSR